MRDSPYGGKRRKVRQPSVGGITIPVRRARIISLKDAKIAGTSSKSEFLPDQAGSRDSNGIAALGQNDLPDSAFVPREDTTNEGDRRRPRIVVRDRAVRAAFQGRNRNGRLDAPSTLRFKAFRRSISLKPSRSRGRPCHKRNANCIARRLDAALLTVYRQLYGRT